MKGTLTRDGSNKWKIKYKGNDYFNNIEIVDLDPIQTRLAESLCDNLDSVEVDFHIQDIENFPYRLGIIYVDQPTPMPTSSLFVSKTKKIKKVVSVYLSGFSFGSSEITCDDFSDDSCGFWCFYNYNESDRRVMVSAYPINKTIIYSITEKEVEE